MAKIRVAIIDDSLFFRTFLFHSLSDNPEFEVAGVYGDPVDALTHLGEIRPDVMMVDMEMPKMRGDEFLRTALPKYPGIRAVVISSLSGNVFDAMHAGAIDFVAKPGAQPGYDITHFTADVIHKIKIASGASSYARVAAKQKAAPPIPANTAKTALTAASPKSLIAIGASTGGTEAILEVIRHFPTDVPGTVIVQHIPPMFTKMYAERLDKECLINVREAQNGDRVVPGTALVAPGGPCQLRVHTDSKGYYVRLTEEPKVTGHCPSVDVLFESVAKTAGRSAVGILLTGMGSDGAHGLAGMRSAGAHTIGQDEASCVIYGMPKVAYDIGGVTEQLPLSAIGTAALRRFRG